VRKTLLVLPIAAAAIGLSAGPAVAANRLVDDDQAQCPTAPFATIQAAVAAAVPGDTITVCDGTYQGPVTIAKDNIDLLSKTIRGATIRPPAGPLAEPRALVHLMGSNDKVRRFRIVGPGTGTADSLRFGVLVSDNANRTISTVSQNYIADITDSTPAANENGDGVRVGYCAAFSGDTCSDPRPGRATVQSNEIVRYQKGGVVVDRPGSYGAIGANTIQGLGLQPASFPIPAQQGIQIGRQAAGNITNNRVSGNLYNGDQASASSFGILVFSTSVARDPRGTQVSQVAGNTVTDNDYGVYLFEVQNWLVKSNRINSNRFGGLLTDLGGQNRFLSNDARVNGGPDCYDGTSGAGTAGTANTWSSNRGVDDMPAGICAP